jgi:hypothetical protein
MPLLPYCIVSSESQVKPPDAGVRGGELLSLEESGLTCFYSEVEGPPKTSDEVRADALTFQETVQAIFAQATVIPFRFVTLLGSEEELHDFLEDHSEQYSEALGRLEGMEQYEMRMKQLPAPAEDEEAGAEYLKQKVAANSAALSVSEALRSAAGELVRGWHFRDSGETVRCYALIQREAQQAFKKAISSAKIPGEVRVVLSGPWPPSEFVLREQASE